MENAYSLPWEFSFSNYAYIICPTVRRFNTIILPGELPGERGLNMYFLIAKTASAMQNIYVAWHFFLWNYHIGRARLHDDRISRLDPHWRDKAQGRGIEQLPAAASRLTGL